ncbi:MAG: PAS domain S-box protein [Oscillochloridaceae bacterium umkhey_bin13]
MRMRSPVIVPRIARRSSRVARLAARNTAQAQRIHELEQHAERMALLGVVGAILSGARDYADGIARIASLLIPRLGSRCMIELTGHDLRAERLYGRWHEGLVAIEPWTPFVRLAPADHPFAAQLATQGASILAQLAPAQAELLQVAATATALVVPIHLGSRTFGLLVLTREQPEPATYHPAELTLADDLAIHLAQTLEKVRLTAASRYATQIKDDAFALLNAIFASTPIGLAALDTNLRYLRVNHALADFDGLPLTAYLGHTPAEILPALAQVIEPAIRQVLATGEAVRDLEVHRGSGQVNEGALHRSWLASYYPVHNSAGQIIGVGAAVIEITERTYAAKALRDRDLALHQAYDAANLGTWQHDLLADPPLLHLDERARIHYGLPTHQVTVETLFAQGHPDDLAAMLAVRDQAHDPTGPGFAVIEHRVTHPDASIHWLVVHIYTVFATIEGQPRAALVTGIVQDVTAQKQAEADLRASEASFRMLTEHAHDLIYRYQFVPSPGFAYVSPSATTITGYTPEEHYADPLLGVKLVHPDDRPLLERVQHDPAALTEPLTLRWQRKDGSLIWTEQINRVVTDATGQPIALEGIARDITARKLAEEQVRAALDTAEQALAAAKSSSARIARLQAMTAALSGALNRREVIEVITRHAFSVTTARSVVISLLNVGNDQLEIIGWAGITYLQLEAFQGLPLNATLPPTVAVRTLQPVWLSSPELAEAQFPGSLALMAERGDQAYAALPMMTANLVVGAISFSYAALNPFDSDERALLSNLADQCAQALERAQFYAEVVESRARLQALSERLVETQEEERRHLARELHDEIGQSLTGLNLVLTIGHNLPHQQLYAQLTEAQRQVATLITQVRHRSLDLRPAMLDELGLYAALNWYLERYRSQTGIQVVAVLSQLDQRFPPVVELTAYRIVQEALTNVARHAGVFEAHLVLWVAGNQLLIEVSDNGVGFDPPSVLRAHRSSGLAGMRERTALLGGELTIDAALGAGTRLLANLPLIRPSEPQESEDES